MLIDRQSVSLTYSASFARAGANILIYTLPILLIATLGCLYLHLEKYNDDAENRYDECKGPYIRACFSPLMVLHFVDRSREDQYFASWKQPVLIRSPLGIISWTELFFVLMFVTLLVWSFSAYVHGMFKNITRQSASKMGETV